MSAADLFDPFEYRGLTFANRIVMAPMTRVRMGETGQPRAMNIEYYRQRASAGLIISEAIAVSPGGRGGLGTPGLYTQAQVDGWGRVTEAVHAAGGRIFAQIWHAGRLGHSSLDEAGLPPASPSAVRAIGEVYVEGGPAPFELPRALSEEEISGIVADYGRAATNARAAGFDGVELHASHGYLIDSFLRSAFNGRMDAFGGSVENRARLLLAVLAELTNVFGADRTSVRISPNATYGGMRDDDPVETYDYLIDQLNRRDIAWLDLIEGDNLITREVPGGVDTDAMIAGFAGRVIVGHGYNLEMATQTRLSARADMIAFGRPFIANPDLVERLKTNAPIEDAPKEIWYGESEAGYIDYPGLAR